METLLRIRANGGIPTFPQIRVPCGRHGSDEMHHFTASSSA
ncbi:MAG: hypothetical protein QW086_07355 [Pyrobaculum sp.]